MASDPYQQKQNSTSGSSSLVFPPEVAQASSFMSIAIRSYADSPGITTGSVGVAKYTVHLPIPESGLENNFHIQFDDHSFGTKGGIAAAISNVIHNPHTIAGSAHAGFWAGVQESVTVGAESLGAALGGLLNPAVAGEHVPGVAEGVSAYLGQALNPNISVLFKGVGIRVHQFQWNFIARNASESQTIQSIISKLQKSALPTPSYGGTFLLDYPDVAFPVVSGPQQSLITFAGWGCFIEDIRVNYGTNPAFFTGTNLPVENNVTLILRERTIVTSQDIK